MKKVAVTGLSGVIGQVFGYFMPNTYTFVDLFNSRKYSGPLNIHSHIKLDLLDKNKIAKVLNQVDPDIIIHMASVTHIDQCEEDKKNKKHGTVWRTNVTATQEIAKYSAKHKKHFVFLSTECVFSGKKEYYNERSKKDPINWYGYTKHMAEEAIIKSGAPAAIIRAVVAYHENDLGKTIYGKILNSLLSEPEVFAVADQFFTPTYTYDIIRAIKKIMKKEHTGIFHVAPDKSISPYDFARIVAKKNKISVKKIKKTTLKEFYSKEKAALRLLHSSLESTYSNKLLKIRPKSPQKNLLNKI